MSAPPPHRIETDRLVLRCWRRDDAALLKEAVDSSLPELQRWLAWALRDPRDLVFWQDRLQRKEADFAEGTDFEYGVFDRSESRVLGGSGLHARIGPDALEIGYWVRTDSTNRGVATEVAGALTRAALRDVGVGWVEIRCDPANLASAAVPSKLGYRLRETLKQNAQAPDGSPRDTMVWEARQL
jgi:RimJ/RimL family protein N-acetyltransferase